MRTESRTIDILFFAMIKIKPIDRLIHTILSEITQAARIFSHSVESNNNNISLVYFMAVDATDSNYVKPKIEPLYLNINSFFVCFWAIQNVN